MEDSSREQIQSDDSPNAGESGNVDAKRTKQTGNRGDDGGGGSVTFEIGSEDVVDSGISPEESVIDSSDAVDAEADLVSDRGSERIEDLKTDFADAPSDTASNEQIDSEIVGDRGTVDSAASAVAEVIVDAMREGAIEAESLVDKREVHDLASSGQSDSVGIPLDQWIPDDSPTPGVLGELERYVRNLFRPTQAESPEATLQELKSRGMEGVQFISDILGGLVADMTGVTSFRVIPKPPLEFEVCIESRREQSLSLRQRISPVAELTGVKLGKKVRFGAKIDTDIKGLRLNIFEGINLEFNLGSLLGVRQVALKGSGLLKRDDSGRLVMLTTVRVPGLDMDMNIVVPIGLLLAKKKKG